MQSINALSLSPDARDWLASSRHPHILHVFDRACNLINERREVLSIVTPQIGNGPFNLVIPRLRKSIERIPDLGASRQTSEVLSDHLNGQSPISIRANQPNLGDLTINTVNAKLWFPRPDWGMLHAKRDLIFGGLKSCLSSWKSDKSDSLRQREALPCIEQTALAPAEKILPITITNYQLQNIQSLISNLPSALAIADISSARKITSKLAGLGIGLTPAGDDFILGAVLAAWIIHPPEIASVLAEEITNTAAPLTTSLSAAWLRSAGRGEAGILWHDFFGALISSDPARIREATYKILGVGETSGADALAGFIGTLMCWAALACSKNP